MGPMVRARVPGTSRISPGQKFWVGDQVNFLFGSTFSTDRHPHFVSLHAVKRVGGIPENRYQKERINRFYFIWWWRLQCAVGLGQSGGITVNLL